MIFNKENAPEMAFVLIRKVYLRDKPYSITASGQGFPQERVYGDMEHVQVTFWTKKGFVKLRGAHKEWFDDPANYELCEVLA